MFFERFIIQQWQAWLSFLAWEQRSYEKWIQRGSFFSVIYRATCKIYYKRLCSASNSSQTVFSWLSCPNKTTTSVNKDNIFDHLRNWFGNQKVSDLWYIFFPARRRHANVLHHPWSSLSLAGTNFFPSLLSDVHETFSCHFLSLPMLIINSHRVPMLKVMEKSHKKDLTLFQAWNVPNIVNEFLNFTSVVRRLLRI